ncbi:small multi-drug export protein [Sediminitomix flava]|uniref:Small multi-drug export protein n=1 Tax=Sediminitomix flava TaxID=379075 RepID=A0A315ZEY4_SEDFL|nr:small multi-drug export protein [Sediminitomix flava]PWJ43733.1 hypothetical protein BC781_10179 [Sediminitomix flava]
MIAQLLKYLSVVTGSMFKFVFGPITGLGMELHIIETITFTIVGMMMSVLILTLAGPVVRNKIIHRLIGKKRKIFSSRNRKAVKIWRSYGMFGVAFLTPLLLTPIGGTLVAVSFGERKIRIISYMFISAVVWSIIITSFFYFLGEEFGVLPTA